MWGRVVQYVCHLKLHLFFSANRGKRNSAMTLAVTEKVWRAVGVEVVVENPSLSGKETGKREREGERGERGRGGGGGGEGEGESVPRVQL